MKCLLKFKFLAALALCYLIAGFAAPTFAEEQKQPVLAQVQEHKEQHPHEAETSVIKFFAEHGIEMKGFVDAYYSYNFSRPSSRRGAAGDFSRTNFVDVRAFDREDNSFTLDNVEITIFKQSTEKDPIGFGFTTNYGEIAQRITFVTDETGTRRDGAGGALSGSTRNGVSSQNFTISQGYITYKAPVGKGIDFKVGKFATWIGAEVWETIDNPNYSRSLLYQNAIAFTNTGIAAAYPVLDNFTATLFIVNGWDTFVDNNNGKTVGYQLNYKISDSSSFIVNGSHGPEQAAGAFTTKAGNTTENNIRHFWDVIYTLQPFEKTAININFDFGMEQNGANDTVGTFGKAATGRALFRDAQWRGIAGIINQTINDSLGIALRGEYFDDKDGARLLVDGLEMWETTLTINTNIRKKLLIRPEVRYDRANKQIFGRFSEQLTTSVGFSYVF